MNQSKMMNKFRFASNKKFVFLLFIIFLAFNLNYFVNNFFSYFLNNGSNADEYYDNNLYFISDISITKIFYTPSQPYIFISSVVNYFLDSPKIATRLVSLFGCFLFLFYFLKRIYSSTFSFIENTYKSTLFICAIFITNQMYIGTSDFLSYVFIVPAFLISIESIKRETINLNMKQSILVGLLFALSVATRPTSIVLIASFYAVFFLIGYFKIIFCKETFIILITSLIVFFSINFFPLIEQNKVVLDVKEVPRATGVTWFQRNYLMAKYWDSDQIPKTQWVSTQEVIDFKKSNPNFVFPKNQIDLVIKEPGLYFRQMVRMFIKASYSSYRYMYALFPILFLAFIKNKTLDKINNSIEIETFPNKFIVVLYFISILLFSFLAVKLFEFRWILPIFILYVYYSMQFVSKLPEKVRFLVYNVSFISGIALYAYSILKVV